MTNTNDTSQMTISNPHVNHTWDDAVSEALDPVDRLVYRSNCLGSDQRVTNTGGGNTSSKLRERDPLSGEEVEVLWVKGSGGDLRTSQRANFASLYQDKLIALQETYAQSPQRGPKTPAEDAMVALYPHCAFNLNPRASSIDTPLHAFIPAKHVDHMHPNAVIAIAASKRSEQLTQEVFGDDVGWVPWLRPGFELGLMMQRVVQQNANFRGLVMGQHGLINWADDDKECYELTLSLIQRAAEYIDARDQGTDTFGGAKYQALAEDERNELLVKLLPWLRGKVSLHGKLIATIQCDATVQKFVNSCDAPRLAELGTSCPDHFLRTKIKPLYVDWNPQSEPPTTLKERLQAGLQQYTADYTVYYERCKHDNSPAMRNPSPSVVLIPGVGMIAWGKDKSESRVTAEFYNCAIEVMRGAEAIDEYVALPQQEAFDIEYWLLEEAKLKRKPPERELARQVVVVIGAGSGIGKAVCQRVAAEGAHVVCADVNAALATDTANELTSIHGQGIGVAGSGVSSCGPAISAAVDITDRQSVRELFKQTVLAYGGIDHVVVTAGVFPSPGDDGSVSDRAWQRTFDVNVMGSHTVVDEAKGIFAAQDFEGTVVLTTSVNAVVTKAGSIAYDTSKAAANHLVRELAVALAPHIRVNAIAPATVVEGSTMFPRDRVTSSLKKYGLAFDETASDQQLRSQLAEFYAQRSLTKRPVTPEDQAEAVYFLMSERASKTTGQIINVDGGLHEAFLH